jgi:hypothetical protein
LLIFFRSWQLLQYRVADTIYISKSMEAGSNVHRITLHYQTTGGGTGSR